MELVEANPFPYGAVRQWRSYRQPLSGCSTVPAFAASAFAALPCRRGFHAFRQMFYGAMKAAPAQASCRCRCAALSRWRLLSPAPARALSRRGAIRFRVGGFHCCRGRNHSCRGGKRSCRGGFQFCQGGFRSCRGGFHCRPGGCHCRPGGCHFRQGGGQWLLRKIARSSPVSWPLERLQSPFPASLKIFFGNLL